MINCPKCNATLPDWAAKCQFCGNTFTPAPKRASANDEQETPGQSLNLKWVWPAYYGIAGWWIVSGLYDVISALTSRHPGSLFSTISIVFAVITLLVGVGLIARVELARGIVNVLCFLQILDGAFGMLGGFVFSFAIPVVGMTCHDYVAAQNRAGAGNGVRHWGNRIPRRQHLKNYMPNHFVFRSQKCRDTAMLCPCKYLHVKFVSLMLRSA